LVLQETQLFAGTIRENLQFVDPSATDEMCLDALKRSQALTLVERGGNGLSTKIGEGGLKLSGGERQRLAIARALLRNPEIIIFDEATSALDSITEHAITKTIQDISRTEKQRIKVLVAHRLSTIMHADRIYVLERGKIVESGAHAELVKKGGLYAALWREQGGNQNS
jgi:ATP-binding cassette subfamily B protein